MPQLNIENAQFRLHEKRLLNLPHFCVKARDYWVVVGSNGSGKTAFSLALQGTSRHDRGDCTKSS